MLGNGLEFFLKSPGDLNRAKEIAAVINENITPELVLSYLLSLQSPAPSQTTSYTRAPIVRQILNEMGDLDKDFVDNYKGTGNSAYRLTAKRPGVIIDTQFDDISYLIKAPFDAETIELTPACAHRLRAGLEFSAGMMRYDLGSRRMEFVGHGMIGSDNAGKPYYKAFDKPKDGYSGSEVAVFTPEPKFNPDTNIFTGSVDGPAGVASVLGAIGAVNIVNKRLRLRTNNVAWTFCDEEENPAEDNTTFGHGARRMAKTLALAGLLPNAVFVVDGHDVRTLPAAAMYGALVSGGRGARFAPDITAQFLPYLVP